MLSLSGFAQVQPVTGISAVYDNLDDTRDDYSAWGGGSYGFPSWTRYNVNFNVGSQNNLQIQGFETGTNVYDFIQLAQRINIMRSDSAVTGTHNIVFFEVDSLSDTNLNIKPSLVETMVNSLRSDLANRGADNVFANEGDGNGNNNNIERIDYIFNAGFPYYNFTDQRGFLVMDRGGNDRFKIAVVLAVDSNDIPTKFSHPVSVLDTEWGPSGISMHTLVMRGYTEDGEDVLHPSADVSSQPLCGVFLSWDQFGLTTNDMVYGYSLAGNDVTTNGEYWTEYTNPVYFPTNTSVASDGGGLDLISGGAMFFDTVLEVAVGDYVWNDYNGDGVQDAVEPGLSNVLVHIYTSSNVLAATARSNSNGWYFAQGLGPGDFYLQFFPPDGYTLSPQYARTDPTTDSDPDSLTGITDMLTLSSGETNITIDCGLYLTPGDLGMSKTVFPTNLNVGDELVFTLSVTNLGLPNTDQIQITDSLPAAFNFTGYGASTGTFDEITGVWDIGYLATNDTAFIAITGTVNAGSGGSRITNSASITRMNRPDTNTANNSASVFFDVQYADLGVGKTASADALEEGQAATFSVSVTNFGPYDVTGVELDDLLAYGYDFISSTPGKGTYDSVSGIWNVGTLTNGETAAMDISVTIASGAGGTIQTNAVSIGACSHEDPNSANDQANAAILIYGADLELHKTVDPPAAMEGQSVIYTIIVTNPGPTNATGVLVSEPLTNGLAYQSHVASQGSYSDGTGIWNIGALPLYSSAVLRITAAVSDGTMDTEITNCSMITATDWPDPDSNNDEDIAVLSVSSLELFKTSDVGISVHPGDEISYTIVASNAGSLTHASVTLTDPVPFGTTYVPASLTVIKVPASSNVVDFSGSGSFMVPAGVTSLTVEAWGGGGGGGRARGYPSTAGGGAGGAYARAEVAVAPLQTYSVTVGAGGIGGNSTGEDTQHGRPGNPSWFGTTNTIFAEGGARGLSDERVNYTNGDPGLGSAANSIGDEVYAGGDGGYGNFNWYGYGGPGGGGAGSGGVGGDASGGSGGNGTALGGGDGADGPSSGYPGSNGNEYGGGGSGGFANNRTDRDGGSGADGHVRISYADGGGSGGSPPDLCSDWSLDAGQYLEATFSVLVNDPLDVLAVTNIVTASSDRQLVPVSAMVVDDVLVTDLELIKTASITNCQEEESFDYFLVLTNHSADHAATGVVVEDLIPPGMDLDSAFASQGTYDSMSGIWDIGTLAAASAVTLELNVTATANSGGLYWTNTAAVTDYAEWDPNLTNNTDSAVILVVGADLTVDKSVDISSPAESSEVCYTIQVRNLGPSDAANVVMAEPLTNGLTYVSNAVSQGSYASGSGLWSVGGLNVGSTATLHVYATVDVGTFGSMITNHSFITGTSQPDPVSANNEDIAEIAVSGLFVEKTSDVVGYAEPGDTITYTISISNLTGVTHTGIDVEDILPDGTLYVANSTQINGPGASSTAGDPPPGLATNLMLDVGEYLTVTFEAEVINPGSSTQLLNTVAVTCDQQPAPVSAWVSDPVQYTDLGLFKSVDDAHPDEGDTVVYTLMITNAGPTDAGDIWVHEALTNGLVYVSHSAGQGTYTNAVGRWNVGSLAVGASAQLVITATVEMATSGDLITNVASIAGSDKADLVSSNNQDSAVVQVVSVDIGIGKSAYPATPVESGLLVYTLSVTNFGPDSATGIVVTDVLPTMIDFSSYTADQGTYDSTTGVWTVGTLNSMATASIAISFVVQTNTAGTSITNTATVTAVDQVDADSGNDTAGVVVTATDALLDLDKTADTAGPVWPGDTITYTLVVTNLSGVNQTNVTLTDPIPTGAVYVADSCQITAPVTVYETFGDQFSFRIYGNNDGTETWSGDWVESEDNGPTTGDVQIQFDNGVDETYTLYISDDNQSIAREADLSAYREARIEFEYQRVGLESSVEYLALEISSAGLNGPWTELDRFAGAATDPDYIRYTNDITAYISTNTAIRFLTPDGYMDDTDIIWIDDLYITGVRRAMVASSGGEPPNLHSNQLLEADEYMSVVFQVWVDNPALYAQIVNQGFLTSDQMTSPQVDTAVTEVETCFSTAPTGLHANPTNVTDFTANWDELTGAFGYQLDVSTTPDFYATDYVPGYSNLAVAGTSQIVTGLNASVIYYFRVRAEWTPLCISSNSETASVTTLDMPSIWTQPDSLDFGIVNVGSFSNLSLLITNTTGGALDITAIEFTGINSNHFSVVPQTSSIPSSNGILLTVTFTPTSNETNLLTMTIYNTSLDNPEMETSIFGIGYDPDALTPELLDYRVWDAAALTNEVTDRSLGEGNAQVSFTVYHASGMTMTGASYDLVYPDGSIAYSNAPFSSISATNVTGKACQVLSATVPRLFPAVLGDYSARITVSSSNGLWLVDEAEFTSVSAGETAPTILDDFFRSNVQDDIGQGWLSSISGPVLGNIQIRDRVLQLYGIGGTGGTNGRVSVFRDISTRYDPVMTNNSGTLTWAFNFCSGHDPLTGYAPGGWAGAFILGSDSTDCVNGTGNGYLVKISSNEVALASFSGGLNLDSDLTILGAVAPLSSATSAIAVQVDLEAATGLWTLYVREWGGSGIGTFDNPLNGISAYEVMQVTNVFHLHRSLPYVGCYWNHGNAAVNTNTTAWFDDIYAPEVMPASEPMEFDSLDNDIMFPTSLGNVLVNGELVPETVPDRLEVVWTNNAEFIITFDPLASDQDPGYAIPAIQRDVRGIGEYRVSAASVDVMTPSNRAQLGTPFPVVSTNGALANYGFEIMPSDGNWILDANNELQSRADNYNLVYEGTNSLHQLLNGTASQTFEFRNESGITPVIAFSGYYLGGMAQVTIAAYATNDLMTPVDTATIYPAFAGEWTFCAIPSQPLGDSTVEILTLTLTASGAETWWDELHFTVDIGTNRPSLRFRPGAENQGLFPQYLFAVDADYNRIGDRLGGTTKFFYTPFDLTPPTPIQMPAAGSGASTETVDDPTTQFDLQWSTNGVGPDDPNSPLHPTKQAGDTDLMSTWHSYRVYYGTFNPLLVPQDDEPETTNGYIYQTYIQNDAFLSWDYVDGFSAIDDPSAGGYQADYSSLTNKNTGHIRLYDLEYDQDYVVVVVGVDKAGNVGHGGVQSWATNNTIRFALIRGKVIDKEVAKAAFPEAELNNTNTDTAAALYWIASGPTNEAGEYTAVSKEYDLITWDARDFQESTNNDWRLLNTVQSNWFVDDAWQMKIRGYIRFYRASYKDRWRKTNSLGQAQQPLASEEVYAMHNVVLSPGPNYVAAHGLPYTNTFRGMFGDTNNFPGGLSAMPDSGSTVIEFYAPGVNTIVSEQYFLSDMNTWIKVGGGDVTDMVQSNGFFNRGFSITLPDPLPVEYVNTTAVDENLGVPLDAMVWTPVLRVPTNVFQQVIHTGDMENRVSRYVYNLVSLNLPVCVHPSEMRLLECGFVNGYKSLSDQIYTINTSTKTVRSGSTIYCDQEGVWRFMTNDAEVPDNYFAPNDVIIIVSKNGGLGNTWTWTFSSEHFYESPTRWMAPE